MIFQDISSSGRRRAALRRPFSYLSALLALAASPVLAGQQPGGPDPPRILQLQVRIDRDAGGSYRILHAARVLVADLADSAAASRENVPLFRLPEAVSDVEYLGGDLPAEQLLTKGRRVSIRGPLPATPFQLIFGYALPPRATAIELLYRGQVDALTVDIQRGSIEARPDPALSEAAEWESGPVRYRRYLAGPLPADSLIVIGISSQRVEWRHRFAVFVATAIAAAAAGFLVWRRGRELAG